MFSKYIDYTSTALLQEWCDCPCGGVIKLTAESGGNNHYRGVYNGTFSFCTWSFGWNNWGLLQL